MTRPKAGWLRSGVASNSAPVMAFKIRVLSFSTLSDSGSVSKLSNHSVDNLRAGRRVHHRCSQARHQRPAIEPLLRFVRRFGFDGLRIRRRKGSFSAVSKPKFASKYAFESSRRDLHNALLCTVAARECERPCELRGSRRALLASSILGLCLMAQTVPRITCPSGIIAI